MPGDEACPSPVGQPRSLDSAAGGLGEPASAPAEQALPRFLRLFGSGAPGTGKTGLLRGLSALLEAADSRWLLGAAPALLRELVLALSRYAAPLRWEPEGGASPGEDPSGAAGTERASEVSLVFCHILAKVEAAKGLDELDPAVVGSVLRQVAGPVFICAVAHAAERPWTRPRSRRGAQELLSALLRVLEYKSVPEFLRGTCEDGHGWFVVVMQCLKPELTKETWQRNPATKYVFCFVLQQVQRPWLGDHLEKVLPPSLLLSDDYQVENKILGVQCLHHIIQNVPAAVLWQFNRVQVVYHALFNHLYSREAQLIQVVLLCILDLLPVLERAPQQLSPNSPLVTPSDKVLQLLLTHMEAENQLSLRRIYAKSLPAFVERLGIQIVRHLKRLQRVIVGYLEIPDGPEEAARIATLETLECTIQHAWPRMTCRLAIILKALLRMMWDVATDRSTTPELVKAALLQRATKCLLLLNHCSQGQVKVLLQGVHQSCENEQLKECLHQIQEDSATSLSAQQLQKDIGQGEACFLNLEGKTPDFKNENTLALQQL
ncbi:TELO2-interacting protein 2 [Python bivittatus]|uniref:TELO2-interacting protein 2 n=1 Tax=Python bivittatus TaxID=176946 RepID=A0A9F2R2E7_PYTBI|nr:TELO2-interacting protein 2 [Python bivittatus]